MTVNLSPTGVSEFPNISTSVGGGGGLEVPLRGVSPRR